ncbi:MAG: hemerythrin domain-containing protein [Gammaproteobacteria bacterium]
MIPVDDLRTENEGIHDLGQILSAVIAHENLYTNEIACELRDRYIARIEAHLSHEDRGMYTEMLGSNDTEQKKVANQFLENTRELRRILGRYKRNWCREPSGPFDDYMKDTASVIELMRERMDLEDKRLFPVLEKAA